MTLELHDHLARLADVVTVDEVETLTNWLRGTTSPQIDLAECTHLHTAALQCLLRFGAGVAVAPLDPFLAGHVAPALTIGGTADGPVGTEGDRT
jgi:hypothetical protein